jgi:nickel-dependent lactate racemase
MLSRARLPTDGACVIYWKCKRNIMSLYYAVGSPETDLSANDLKSGLCEALDKLGVRQKVLALPPDITRFHSRAGELTRFAWEYYGDALVDVMPAIGTHVPMTSAEIETMFGNVPQSLFRVHDWREGVVTLGEVPADFIREQSENALDFTWPAQVDRLIAEGGHDLILSPGQVVPHEVIGMANYNKNVLIGTGGKEGINKSHFLGAVYGMERIMGRADNPVRRVLNYAVEHFAKHLPVVYAHTVVAMDDDGRLVTRGLFVGDDIECFTRAAELSLRVNFRMMDRPIKKAVVFLDPKEFRSTWLGNKAVYRTRMALADDGDLIVLAPGVKEFGEDKTIDRLIRKYGYVGTPEVLRLTQENEELGANLSAAAHLIHGSSEGRFRITYAPGHLTQQEVEGVNFAYGDLAALLEKYDPSVLRDGYNTVDGEEIFYISNPALGLWAYEGRFS